MLLASLRDTYMIVSMFFSVLVFIIFHSVHVIEKDMFKIMLTEFCWQTIMMKGYYCTFEFLVSTTIAKFYIFYISRQ